MEQVFENALGQRGFGRLRRGRVRTLQVNIGRRCDLACHHCHVEAGPKREEALDRRGTERVLALLEANPQVGAIDLTGGAPEMNPHFRFLVTNAHRLGRRVIDRCNLTILLRPEQEDTADFLAAHEVEVVASLPCYSRDNVERQRGRGVFVMCIEALGRLNALGYGQKGSPLALDLVYNPSGPSLPPSQAELEEQYRHELRELFGIEFRRLLTITNMPIRRFSHALQREGELDAYLELLVNHFNPATVPDLMCRSLLSVDHRGRLYDCDFNQALGLPLAAGPRSIWDLTELDTMEDAPIATASHCFGCTAGAGSSCTGALAQEPGQIS